MKLGQRMNEIAARYTAIDLELERVAFCREAYRKCCSGALLPNGHITEEAALEQLLCAIDALVASA